MRIGGHRRKQKGTEMTKKPLPNSRLTRGPFADADADIQDAKYTVKVQKRQEVAKKQVRKREKQERNQVKIAALEDIIEESLRKDELERELKTSVKEAKHRARTQAREKGRWESFKFWCKYGN